MASSIFIFSRIATIFTTEIALLRNLYRKHRYLARRIKRVNENTMGMYDVLPTLGNMMGFTNKYALGHDIYDIKDDNFVVFPNGNFVTNTVYYSSSANNYLILKENVIIEEDYLENIKKRAEDILSVSNDIIVHNLIKKEGDNIVISTEE